jgi:hypothetical protein
MTPKSFAAPDTHFHLIRSDTPRTVDGFKPGEPTGEIRCDECGRDAENIDEIPHAPDCPQRWVRSRWWVDHLRDA